MATQSDLIQERLPHNEELLLLGVTGSTAYGLAHEGSDEDRLGLYAVPTTTVLGFGFDSKKASRVWTQPEDVQLHEIQKFLALMLQGNPTITELLFLDEYEFLDPAITELITERSRLLGAHGIRNRYMGYAVSQAKRLQRREGEGKKGFASDLGHRTAKHGRHCFRLLIQAEQLLATGSLSVNVSDRRDELFEIGSLAESDVDAFVDRFEIEKDRVENLDSTLPDQPDVAWAESWLINFRNERWERVNG